MTPTQTKYASLQKAYDFFNKELFAGALPPVLITLQRKSKSLGYFSPDRFAARVDGSTPAVHELAMNPSHFGRTDAEILSTLVHEMCHVWQETCGRPPRKAYHDKEFAARMEAVGLITSDTAEEGGARVGQKMSHYVAAGGLFEKAAAKLVKAGFALEYVSRENEEGAGGRKKDTSKTKFTCPECGLNAWAKAEAALLCGACYAESGEVVEMEA